MPRSVPRSLLPASILVLMLALALGGDELVRDGGSASAGGGPTVIATIPAGTHPHGVAVNPDTNRIYVNNQYGPSVTVVDGATNSVLATVGVAFSPIGVRAYPARNKIYVAHYGMSGISVIDGATNAVTTLGLSGSTAGVAANPANDRVYASVYFNDSVAVIDAGTGGGGSKISPLATGREASRSILLPTVSTWRTTLATAFR